MRPEERIDVVDLTRYAIKKRFLKSSCEMKMDDPLRKLTQRILSKMFSNAVISKNRQRHAYNVAFTGKQFCGDFTNRLTREQEMMFPCNIAKSLIGLNCLLFEIPKVFWPYIVAQYESGNMGIYGYNRYSSYEKVDHNYVKKVAKSLEAGAYPHYDIKRLTKLWHDVGEFSKLYKLKEEGDITIRLENYGFSFCYSGYLTQRQYRYGYHNERKPGEEKISRRFQEPSVILEDLERLKHACKMYKSLIKMYDNELKFIQTFDSAYRHDLEYTIRSAADGLSDLNDPETKEKILGQVLDEQFGTSYYKNKSKDKKKLKSKITVAEQPSRTMVIGNSAYNLDDIQKDFNDWAQNRE